MIKLFKDKEPETFKVDTSTYSSNPSLLRQARIRIIGDSISQRNDDFLKAPQSMMYQWEEMTEEDIPMSYFRSMPQEVSYLIRHINGEVAGYGLEYLPLIDKDGKEIEYSDENLVDGFQKTNPTYLFDEEVAKSLDVKLP